MSASEEGWPVHTVQCIQRLAPPDTVRLAVKFGIPRNANEDLMSQI